MITLEEAPLLEFEADVHSQTWNPGHHNHQLTYRCFLVAARLAVKAEDALQIVLQQLETAGAIIDPHAVGRQLKRAFEYVNNALVDCEVSARPQQPKVQFCPQILERISQNLLAPNIVDFVGGLSPINPGWVDSHCFLTHLYRPGERVVMFTKYKSQGQLLWEHGVTDRSDVPTSGPDGVWFLANPVDGQYYPNPREGGKRSRRSEESVSNWRYMVIESDKANRDHWLATVIQMPLRIAAIYESGGNSIHVLVRVDAGSKNEWDEIRNRWKGILEILGADPGALTAVRLSRLAQAWRGKVRQTLLFLDPNPSDTPICQREPRGLRRPPRVVGEVEDLKQGRNKVENFK